MLTNIQLGECYIEDMPECLSLWFYFNMLGYYKNVGTCYIYYILKLLFASTYVNVVKLLYGYRV